LLGSDAPERREHLGAGGGPIRHEHDHALTDAERAEAIRATFARLGVALW
jgi:hypothetical protein